MHFGQTGEKLASLPLCLPHFQKVVAEGFVATHVAICPNLQQRRKIQREIVDSYRSSWNADTALLSYAAWLLAGMCVGILTCTLCRSQ